MKIIITGDFYISDKYKDSNLFDSSITEVLFNADYRIVNLEAPITKNYPKNKIIKTGPHLRMSEENVINHLDELNIDCVTLANNHILDYGTEGINNTFDVLNKNRISYLGAGENLSDATKPYLFEKKGVKVALVNFCENEWSIAESNSPGANPMDIIDNAHQIKYAKELADYVIVIVHGGHEYYNLPSPRMQKQYRFYADQGADIVVGHHTHCISGNEVYNGVPIYYSLGNFLFTDNSTIDEWYTGLVLELEILNGSIRHKVHPVRQQKRSFNLSLLKGKDKDEVLKRVENFNRTIIDVHRLNESWVKYIDVQSEEYLNYWSPLSFIKNRYIKSIFRRLGINFINKKGALLYLNLLRCEAHKYISESILKKYIDS
jgi:poly-gamma-glutamate synthesis protein (capsule biosynthesis protein)